MNNSKIFSNSIQVLNIKPRNQAGIPQPSDKLNSPTANPQNTPATNIKVPQTRAKNLKRHNTHIH